MTAIAAATVWSVSNSARRLAVAPTAPAVTTSSTAPQAAESDFFKKLYDARLEEEGDRSLRVEEMIKRGELSGHPAMHAKENDGGGK